MILLATVWAWIFITPGLSKSIVVESKETFATEQACLIDKNQAEARIEAQWRRRPETRPSEYSIKCRRVEK